MNINELIKKAHDNAVKRGFYDCWLCKGNDTTRCVCKGTGKTAKTNVCCGIAKELKEFYNSEPSDTFHKDSEQSEISDIILILLAYCGEMNIDIEKALIEKSDYNETRG